MMYGEYFISDNNFYDIDIAIKGNYQGDELVGVNFDILSNVSSYEDVTLSIAEDCVEETFFTMSYFQSEGIHVAVDVDLDVVDYILTHLS